MKIVINLGNFILLYPQRIASHCKKNIQKCIFFLHPICLPIYVYDTKRKTSKTTTNNKWQFIVESQFILLFNVKKCMKQILYVKFFGFYNTFSTFTFHSRCFQVLLWHSKQIRFTFTIIWHKILHIHSELSVVFVFGFISYLFSLKLGTFSNFLVDKNIFFLFLQQKKKENRRREKLKNLQGFVLLLLLPLPLPLLSSSGGAKLLKLVYNFERKKSYSENRNVKKKNMENHNVHVGWGFFYRILFYTLHNKR